MMMLSIYILAALGAIGGIVVQALVVSCRLAPAEPALHEWPRTDRRSLLVATLLSMLIFPLVGRGLWDRPAEMTIRLAAVTVLLAIAWGDVNYRLIPSALVATLMGLGVLNGLVGAPGGLATVLVGGAVGLAAMLALVVAARLVLGPGALGLGDATLALGIGCLVGYPHVLDALVAGMACGGLGALIAVLLLRRGPRSTLPYAPFLVGGVILLLAGGPVV